MNDNFKVGQKSSYEKIFSKEEVEFEVISVREDKPIAILKTTIYNEKNEVAIEGEAAVKYKVKE